MNYQSVKPQKGSEIVMQHIREQIQSGVFAPGAKLPTVVEFAENFQVGRSTIREALSGLKAMGWLTIRHGGGSFVSEELPREMDSETSRGLFYQTELLQEVLEVRKFIEVGCATLAAERRTATDLEQMEHALQQMEISLGDEQSSDQADIHFHLCIARASHNTLFTSMMESLSERLQASMKESRRLWFFADRATAVALLQEHTLIYESIRDQNSKLAAERIIKHISKVEQVVQKLGGGH
ncbi:FadR/GntR family transcriptional regulator [Paenibacillus sp. CMAA1364]